MKTEFKSGRGGARKGAGRPPGKGKRRVADQDRREQIGIRLPAHMIDWLRNRQGMNPGRIIETALIHLFGKEIEKHEKK